MREQVAQRRTVCAVLVRTALLFSLGSVSLSHAGDVADPAANDFANRADLQSLIAYAHEHNPDFKAQQLAADAARALSESAGALPDPSFQIELMDFTNEMSGRSASLLPGEVESTRYRVVQPLPFWGKRDLRSDAAVARWQQMGAMVEAHHLEVETRIKTAYFRYYGAAQGLRIERETLTLLDAIEQLARSRYSLGLVPQQDALRAQSEITAMRIDIIKRERELRVARAQLNAQLPRAADAPLAQPVTLAAPAALPGLEALYAQARQASPELAALRAGLDVASRERDLTYRERYPDFAIGLTSNRPRDGVATWDFMLEMTIPLQQGSRRAEERRSQRTADAALAGLAGAEVSLNGRLGERLAAYEGARASFEMLEQTLLPQATATYRAAEAGYGNGRVNFDTLINAQQQVLRTRLAQLAAEVDMHERHAEIEQLIGASS